MVKFCLQLKFFLLFRNLENFSLLIHDYKQNENLHIKKKVGKESVLHLQKWEHLVKEIADFENHKRFKLKCLSKDITPVSIKFEHILQHLKVMKLLGRLKDNY